MYQHIYYTQKQHDAIYDHVICLHVITYVLKTNLSTQKDTIHYCLCILFVLMPEKEMIYKHAYIPKKTPRTTD